MLSVDCALVSAVGKSLQNHSPCSQELGWKRSDYVISTKIFWGGKGVNDKGLSRKHIIEGMKVRAHMQLRCTKD